ncbi:hypothetical protein IB680_03680 [Francisella philomiragia]|uniref:hypothetical protein n=1 Tax=Francisella philomiragia TaxID=28110 RepID=UPI000B595104|nr:hypothetical protein [Francisella philomiragia]MBK2094774.1 hypothetical protein [Francisella philomiragia]
MITQKLKFCFKGSRDYVHGTDIFNELKNCFDDSLNHENTMLDLSFHGVAKKNLDIIEGVVPSAKGVIKFLDRSNNRKTYSLVENKNDIDCRYEYPESKIVMLCKVNFDAQLVSLDEYTSFSFIENIVALNKSLLESLFGKVSGKWYFTRLQLKRMPFDYYPVKLEFRSNFNFRLTKTEIFLNSESIGFIYFSLV